MGRIGEETRAEKKMRHEALSINKIKAITFMVFFIIFSLGIVALNYAYGTKTASYGIGNPYECKQCSKINMACSDHRNFNQQEAIEEKIGALAERYKPTNDEWNYYGKEAYNINCDFCKELNEECYSCSYTRETLTEIPDRIYENWQIQSLLCKDCTEIGYADCLICRDILYKQILNDYNKEK